jgi:hypothetical protein
VAASLLRTQRHWSIATVSHNACTGRLIGEFYNGTDRSGSGLRDWGYRLNRPAAGRFDVVTMTFGGNDLGFPAIVRGCETVPTTWAQAARDVQQDFGCAVSEHDLDLRLDNLVAGRPSLRNARPFGPGGRVERLAAFYADVASREVTADGILVVVGYPRLFEPAADWPAWRGGMCAGIFGTDADMLGREAERLDSQLRAAVAEARQHTTRRIEFVSVEAAYAGHSLCARDTEWLNGLSVGFWDRSIRPSHSFHPNEIGHQVTAEHVAATVESVSALRPQAEPVAPPSTQTRRPATTPPPLRAGSRFGIGDEFDSYCQVAWPTAPTRTTTAIEMTMTCHGVPQQFTFVDVAYPDPNLPITPSTGRVHVHGRVQDIATSEYGFKVLVVLADRIDL